MRTKESRAAAYQRGREDMKAELIAALQGAFDCEVGYGRHDRGNACSQCADWHLAIEAAEAVDTARPSPRASDT